MGKQRRSTIARGYGAEHQRQRKRWVQVIAKTGEARRTYDRPACKRHAGQCPEIIRPGDRFDLEHSDDRICWTGPKCPGCDRAAGGRNGAAAAANGSRQTVIRPW